MHARISSNMMKKSSEKSCSLKKTKSIFSLLFSKMGRSNYSSEEFQVEEVGGKTSFKRKIIFRE